MIVGEPLRCNSVTDLHTVNYSGSRIRFDKVSCLLQVLLRDGQVELIVVPSSDYTHIRETVTVGEGLNDNEWHSLHVFYQDGYDFL